MNKRKKRIGFGGDSRPILDLVPHKLKDARVVGGSASAIDPNGAPRAQSILPENSSNS